MARLLRVLAVLGAALGALLLVAWLAQRRLLYFPERSDRRSAEQRARRLGLEPWVVGAEVQPVEAGPERAGGSGGREASEARRGAPRQEAGELLGWRARHPSGAARGRLVVLHGNAGSALDRIYFVDAFRDAAPGRPLDVYLVEYPGYGPRAGSPTQEGLVAAARRAIALARGEGPGPVILAGESLGGAVAALAAAAEPSAVDGLVLVIPLASVPAVARRHYPAVPGVFFRDPYRADLALPRYGGPVAFLVAGEDEVVFADLCRALHDRYPGPKRLWEDPRAGHNTVRWDPGLPRWREMIELVAP